MSGQAVRAYEGDKKWRFTPSQVTKARKPVEYLQKTLFRALKEHWKLRVINRFRLLLKNSYYNKILSIYKVTRLNNGKKTAGIDGIKIKIKSQSQLNDLTRRLFADVNRDQWKPKPNRRIEIPKPDGTTRPLGIPTQRDRIVQGILTTILETEVEELINTNKLGSYGFRRKMSTAEAINCIASYAHHGKHAIVIEADITKCFDQISHSHIEELLSQNQPIQGAIANLLKAGHWDELESRTITSDVGTPQGGIISPAISNLVLRSILDKPWKEFKIKNTTTKSLTTYADDLVIALSPQSTITKDPIKLQNWTEETTKSVMQWLETQLETAGLKTKPAKTRVITDDTPFNFLGYEIQRGKGIRIDPDKVKRLRNKLKESLKRGRSEKRVVKEINPILRGFYNYAAKFSSGKMWRQMGRIDLDISARLFKLYQKYDIGQVKFTDVPKTTKYMSVPKGATWLDNQDYWDKRDLTFLSPRKRALYKKQQGKCALCHRQMQCDENLETHHILPKGKGGKDKNTNVMLVHLHCHQIHHESGELQLPKEVNYGQQSHLSVTKNH
jgi:RNA-directed DNA polymerase